jgi:glutaryl-CoA dehydrogenase
MAIAKQALPQLDGDFYHISTILSEEDQGVLHRVRDFMQTEAAPIITQYWIREEFPHQLVPGLAALGVAGTPYRGYGCPGKTTLLDGMIAMEFGRVDCSIATFMGVHKGRERK